MLCQYNSNGTRTSYTYDDADRITELNNVGIRRYLNVYDKVGNRTRTINTTIAADITTYTYDQAYQLRSDRTHYIGPANTYTYDAVGNRLTFRRTDGSRATYTYDAANQLTRILDGGVPSTLTYDQAGNALLHKNTVQPFNITLTWDAESRLAVYHQTGVSAGSGFNQRLTHTYNGDGQRVERNGGPGTARYQWDGQNIHLKLNSSNGLIDNYQYEPSQYGKLICTSTKWHHYDPLGSTAILTTSAPSASDIYVYGAWGQLDTPDVLNTAVDPFLFVGREGYYSDDEGIDKNTTSPNLPYYVRARFYNALWGRWLNPDPPSSSWLNGMAVPFVLGPGANVMRALVREVINRLMSYAPSLPDNIRDYIYVLANPVGHVDPSGLKIDEEKAKTCVTCTCNEISFDPALDVCRTRRNCRLTPRCYYVPDANGCGPISMPPWVVPDRPGIASFKPCCDEHDLCWGKCGANKASCDHAFGMCNRRECFKVYNTNRDSRGRRRYSQIDLYTCLYFAELYQWFVEIAGQNGFESSQNEACACCCPLPGS